jgi:photosystem II stability/assembly factor-like uncharacterized protein
MKKLHSVVFILALLIVAACSSKKSVRSEIEETAKDDWFINQRIFPYGKPDYESYNRAVQWKHNLRAPQNSQFTQSWQFAGTVNIGGRLTDVEMPSNSLQVMYACAASGGIFKSVNAGNSWTPIFDSQPSLSIGDLAIAPSNPDILYVGTGEANAGGGSLTYDGMGVFKSIDAGTTWTSVGLTNTRNTGRIAIHPGNPNIAYVATMGDLFGDNPDRGVYKTIDGGLSWQNVLFANDSTGAIEVVINSQRPDTIYASLWTRVRRPDRRNYGGPESGIYRSYNGGATWTKLTNGLPVVELGRVGIDISKTNPSILYATVNDKMGANIGIYKTTNNGNTWTNVTSNFDAQGNGYWFGRIKIDPTDANFVYEIDFDAWKTTNGGGSWTLITGGVHVDQHEVFIHPLNHNLILLGNDGGFHISNDGGITWAHDEKLPITQFYTCEIDEQNPLAVYGGTQDNGTITTSTGSLSDWYSIWGGDGFVVKVDPTNSSNVYAEYQYAGINTGTDGIDPIERTNWNTPYLLNPINPKTLYLGTNYLFKSINYGDYWNPISPDLTNGTGTQTYPIVYGTITSIAVAKSDTNVIYVGTDDGNVYRTTNEGNNWTLISPALPVRWVTDLEVHPANALDVYITLSGYRYHENMSHVYHTINGGNSWTDIGGNLPDVPVNDIVLDTTANALYLATDIGMFYSYVGSNNWQTLGMGIPIVPVVDLRLHEPSRTLLAATYGRSMYKYDLNVITAVASASLPGTDVVMQLSSNPVHENTVLTIYNAERVSGEIALYNLSGEKLKVIHSGILTKGNHSFRMNPGENSLQSGIYFVQYKSNRTRQVLKMIYGQ